MIVVLIGVFPGREAEVAQLAQTFNIALLSNTSRFNRDHYTEECEPVFWHIDQLFFSFDMGLRKPDPTIISRPLA